ncbi:nucleoside hydrolase [Caldicellulosiruptoraceae bacterium PP1]
MEKKKVILDTDIGSDIDDAFCLAYLLGNPNCELLGITTVSGEAEKRAMMASALCYASGKDIPIYPGIEEPLFSEQKQPIAQQAKKLSNWKHKKEFEKGYAIEFLRKTIREHPHEISLLAIGPLTNIALLFMIDPEIPTLLKEIILMAGYFKNKTTYGYEWNVMCDPYAATKVFETGVKVHKSVGLDVTLKVTMNSKEVRKIIEDLNSELLMPVIDFADVWFENNDIVTFHDPLAAVALFNNEVCKFVKGNVNVHLDNEKFGATSWTYNENATNQIALEVDSSMFFDKYFEVFRKTKEAVI